MYIWISFGLPRSKHGQATGSVANPCLIRAVPGRPWLCRGNILKHPRPTPNYPGPPRTSQGWATYLPRINPDHAGFLVRCGPGTDSGRSDWGLRKVPMYYTNLDFVESTWRSFIKVGKVKFGSFFTLRQFSQKLFYNCFCIFAWSFQRRVLLDCQMMDLVASTPDYPGPPRTSQGWATYLPRINPDHAGFLVRCGPGTDSGRSDWGLRKVPMYYTNLDFVESTWRSFIKVGKVKFGSFFTLRQFSQKLFYNCFCILAWSFQRRVLMDCQKMDLVASL